MYVEFLMLLSLSMEQSTVLNLSDLPSTSTRNEEE